MAGAYATADDVATLYRSLSADEITRADMILDLISDMIRAEYEIATGGSYDDFLDSHPAMKSTVKLVCCDVCYRILRSSLSGDPATQTSQSALGYSESVSYAVPGGGVANAFLERDWKRLKISKPRLTSVRFSYDLWDSD